MTYSVGVTGARADQVPQVENLTLDDTVARLGGMQQAMALGTPFLARGPDGASRYYTFDAERSTPDVPVLKPL